MGILKEEVKQNVTNARGLNSARDWANKWFIKTLRTLPDTAVQNYNRPFAPGKIYVFRYETPVTEDKLSWWDANPVVLSLGREGNNDIGINLNLLPQNARLEFLDRIYSRFQSRIKRSMKSTPNRAIDQVAIEELNYQNLRRYLRQTGVQFAVRQYVTNLRRRSAIVSYENWSTVALFDLVQIEKAGLGTVFADYNDFISRNR